MLNWWTGTNCSALLSQNIICPGTWSELAVTNVCRAAFSSLMIGKKNLKPLSHQITVPSPTPEGLHKPSRYLQTVEQLAQGDLFGNQSGDGAYSVFLFGLGMSEDPISHISLSWMSFSIVEPRLIEMRNDYSHQGL